MNRPLKFRIWDTKQNKFEKYWEGELVISLEGKVVVRVGNHTGDYYKDFDDRFTAQQFTGLFDKNGREIYEGDIVIWCNKIYSTNLHDQREKYESGDFEVEFQNGGFGGKSNGNFYHFFCFKSYEVIGNIFENPELLKEK